MNKSETIGKLAEALSKAQGAMKPAIKDSDNPYFKSKYADLSSVWEAIREPLAVNGLSISQLLESGVGNGDSITLTTILMHSSGEWISSSVTAKPAKSDAQSIGSLTSYLRRYSLSAIVGGYADDDDAETDRIGHQEKPAEITQKPFEESGKKPITKARTLGKAHNELFALLSELYAGDREKMKTMLKELTTWVDKDSSIHEGKTSLYDISDKMAGVALGKLRAMVEEGKLENSH